MTLEPKCGLIAKDRAVPLEGVRVDVRLSGPCAEVTVTQRYRNRETVPVEAVYVFPLDEGAAVCGFSAKIGDKLVHGKVEEREAAFARYDDAMQDGHGAFLLDQERPNVFTASVGNLRPGEQVELSIRYVSLCAREGGALRLMVPTTVSPRYVPKDAAKEVGQSDGERVNPEHLSSVPYGLTLRVDVGTSLESVESSTHPIRTVLRDGGATVELSQEDVALDRDFVLLLTPRKDVLAMARVARESDGRRVAMLTFLPENLPVEQGHEVLFLLDCSGSMGGESITQARRALALCIRALSEGDTFNVVCFGTGFQAMWDAPRAYTQATLDEASKYVERIEANLGGTEILAPLTALLEAKVDEKRGRRVLLLTDGQVSNEDEVLEVARKHAQRARVFAFGIGAGASEHLVRGVARASRGAAEMIAPGERIEPKVLRTFARLRTPSLDDVRVDYGALRVTQAPALTPPVFTDDVLTVFARIDGGTSDHVTLTAAGRSYRVPLDLEHAEPDGPIPTLWAREVIRELDDETSPRGSKQRRAESENRKRDKLVELGTRYGLLSSATSFVAIEERSADERQAQPAELRRIPVALTTGWGGRERGGVPGGPIMPLMMSAPMAMPMSVPMGAAPREPARMRSRMVAKSSAGAPPMGEMVASAPPAAQAEEDRLFALLMSQRADGSFAFSSALESWLGRDKSARLGEAMASAGEALVVTSVVVLLLERDERTRDAEWRPAALKARAFLARQATQFDAAALI